MLTVSVNCTQTGAQPLFTSEVIFGVGTAFTVTVATEVFEQPLVVPVTVYVVVANGFATAVLVPVTVAPADQVYDVPPLAVKLADAPAQIVTEFTEIVGNGFTVTVAVAVLEQPLSVPVTV